MNPLTAAATASLDREDLRYFDPNQERHVRSNAYRQDQEQAQQEAPNRSRSTRLKVAIEYHAPYFVVLLKNPGQNGWIYVESKTCKIHVQNMFGDVVRYKPAVEKFESYQDAERYVAQNMPHAQVTKRATGFLSSMFTHSGIVGSEG